MPDGPAHTSHFCKKSNDNGWRPHRLRFGGCLGSTPGAGSPFKFSADVPIETTGPILLFVQTARRSLDGAPRRPVLTAVASDCTPRNCLPKANHPKGWDAKLLVYVPLPRDRVAGLPG